MKRTIALAAFALTSSLALAAGTDDAASDAPETTTTTTSETATQSSEETGMNDQMGAEGHDHPADGGQPPAGIAAEENPTYPVDTEVVLTADHMPGMEGAEATIAGAFDTTTYSVSYTPTDGGNRSPTTGGWSTRSVSIRARPPCRRGPRSSWMPSTCRE